MEYCQIIFLNIAIIGFISQLLQFIFFFKRNSLSKKDNTKDFLEKIYNQSSSLEIYKKFEFLN